MRKRVIVLGSLVKCGLDSIIFIALRTTNLPFEKPLRRSLPYFTASCCFFPFCSLRVLHLENMSSQGRQQLVACLQQALSYPLKRLPAYCFSTGSLIWRLTVSGPNFAWSQRQKMSQLNLKNRCFEIFYFFVNKIEHRKKNWSDILGASIRIGIAFWRYPPDNIQDF